MLAPCCSVTFVALAFVVCLTRITLYFFYRLIQYYYSLSNCVNQDCIKNQLKLGVGFRTTCNPIGMIWNEFVHITIIFCLSLACEAGNNYILRNNCVHINLPKFIPQQADLVHRGIGIYVPQLIAIPGILTTYPRIEKFSWALSQRLKLLFDLPSILGNTWYSLRTFWILKGMYIFHLFPDVITPAQKIKICGT